MEREHATNAKSASASVEFFGRLHFAVVACLLLMLLPSPVTVPPFPILLQAPTILYVDSTPPAHEYFESALYAISISCVTSSLPFVKCIRTGQGFFPFSSCPQRMSFLPPHAPSPSIPLLRL